tara:strand:+ start:74 stop:673 length:600 start_codon:yes stop_codon:yes gene_type:complete
MIEDIKHVGLFRVDLLRFVLDIDHKAIADYTLEHSKTWDRYTTFHDRELNAKWQENLPDREKFEQALAKGANEFVERTERRKFTKNHGGQYLHYWVSVYRKHDQHGTHNHPNSLIAGTYYPLAGKGASSILLESPWVNHIMHDTLPQSKHYFDYKPKTGDMIMWPSWIAHRVPPQESDDGRIAISFNFDYGRYHQETYD